MKKSGVRSIVIDGRKRWLPDLMEAFEARHLIWLFVKRNLRIRFAQTILGPLWLIVQAVLTAATYSLFFGNFLKVPSEGLPYPVFVVAGTLLWSLFQRCATDVSTCIVSQANLIGKVYFPRIAVPISAMFTAVFDQIPLFVVLLGLCAFYGVGWSWLLLLLPLLLVFTLVFAVGVGLCVTALDVIYRDARIVLIHVLQLMFYVTPVAFPLSLLSEKWRVVIALNPMSGLIECFRGAISGQISSGDVTIVIVSMALSMLTLVIGLIVFARTEPLFVDNA